MVQNLLIIDVSQANQLTLILDKRDRCLFRTWQKKSSSLLVYLDQFLKATKTQLKSLRGLALIEGGGTFSGVRGAAAILNILHLVTGIPVLGVDKRKFIETKERQGESRRILAVVEQYFRRPGHDAYIKPIYTGEPNITVKPITHNP